jgi:hypothetical protein
MKPSTVSLMAADKFRDDDSWRDMVELMPSHRELTPITVKPRNRVKPMIQKTFRDKLGFIAAPD